MCDVVVIELRCDPAGGTQCVAGDLAGGVGHRSDPERRFERLRDRAGGGVCRQLGKPSHECECDSVPRCVEPCEIEPSGTAF